MSEETALFTIHTWFWRKASCETFQISSEDMLSEKIHPGEQVLLKERQAL